VAILRMTYTTTTIQTIDITDNTLTRSEISKIADKALDNVNPEDAATDAYWEWDLPPVAKGEASAPPIDYYQETPFGRAATNGHIILFERSPIAAKTDEAWIDFTERTINITKLIDSDFCSLPLHQGLFAAVFEPFRKIKGLKVLGKDALSPAHLVVDGNIIAVIMPVQLKGEPKTVFQFNKERKKERKKEKLK
jgi:hypothetical protein